MDAVLIYIDDWFSSPRISEMDAYEERGYHRLLLHAGKELKADSEDNKLRGLPFDEKVLARRAKLLTRWDQESTEIECQTGQTARQKLLACFFYVKDGRAYGALDDSPIKCRKIKGEKLARLTEGQLYNERLLEVFFEHQARKISGQKSSKQRWSNETAHELVPQPEKSNKVVASFEQNGNEVVTSDDQTYRSRVGNGNKNENKNNSVVSVIEESREEVVLPDFAQNQYPQVRQMQKRPDPPTDSDCSICMEQFWNSYPNQTNYASFGRAFISLWGRADGIPDAAYFRNVVMPGLARYKASAKWADQDGKFIPSPDKFIWGDQRTDFGKKWVDKPTPAKKSSVYIDPFPEVRLPKAV